MKCIFFRENGSNDEIYYMIFVDNIIQAFKNNDVCPENVDIAQIEFDKDFSSEEALEMMRNKAGWTNDLG